MPSPPPQPPSVAGPLQPDHQDLARRIVERLLDSIDELPEAVGRLVDRVTTLEQADARKDERIKALEAARSWAIGLAGSSLVAAFAALLAAYLRTRGTAP